MKAIVIVRCSECPEWAKECGKGIPGGPSLTVPGPDCPLGDLPPKQEWNDIYGDEGWKKHAVACVAFVEKLRREK